MNNHQDMKRSSDHLIPSSLLGKTRVGMSSFLTFLSRNKAYTAINVFGFSISLMFVILIGLYVQQEYNVDKMHTKASRIWFQGYDMKLQGATKNVLGSHWRMQKHLRSLCPEIENSCAIVHQDLKVSTPVGEEMRIKVLMTDSTFFRIFDFPLVKGNPSSVLNAQDNAIISEELARKLYGDADPIGRPLILQDSVHTIITGVMQKMEGSSITPAEAIIRFEKTNLFNSFLTDEHMGNSVGAQLAFLVKDGFDPNSKSADMDRYLKDVNWIYQMPNSKPHIFFAPLSQLHFSTIPAYTDSFVKADSQLVKILFWVGLIILLFAIFNYINLTVAQSGLRSKEMATRRLFGSQRHDIMLRLIRESILLCTLSAIASIILAALLAPYASRLIGTDILFSRLFSIPNLSLIVLGVLAVGLLAGILPAYYVSQNKPIDVVRGTFRMSVKMRFSHLFIIVQTTATIILLACSLTIGLQLHHLVSAPLGYQTRNILNIFNPTGDSVRVGQFMQRLQTLPCVEVATACQSIPLEAGNNITRELDGRTVSIQYLVGDSNYLKVFDIQLAKTYPIATSPAVYVSQGAFHATGESADSRTFKAGIDGKTPVAGVLSPLHLGVITTETNPVVIYVVRHKPLIPWQYAIKIKGNPTDSYRQIAALYKDVFHEDIDDSKPVFVDDQVKSRFEKEQRTASIISIFTGIAILISLLGLVAMSTYFIQQHRREIALRKVFGSTNRQILTRLLHRFAIYVAVSFVVAVPVIWHFMGDWLQAYSYRIALSPWIYLVAGLIVLFFSLAAVFVQSHAASNENPVKYMKQE
uniref:ABC transporter permease n=1 Tax=Prevotella sp. GTC17259 TaxID=3236795 RepID=A0AB33JAL7_9BACT